MADIILKSGNPEKAVHFLMNAVASEQSRLKYCIERSKARVSEFEKKYNVSSIKFMRDWSAEDLEGKDLEYISWAGEYELLTRLEEQMLLLENIEYAS